MNLNRWMFENQRTATISTETDRGEEAFSNVLRKCVTAVVNAHNTLAHKQKQTECSLKEENKKKKKKTRGEERRGKEREGEETADGSCGERIKN